MIEMNNDHSLLKVELGINAQKFIQQVQINNKTIEEQIIKGLELAINDIAEGDNFVESIRENTKKELENIVNRTIVSWEVKNKIKKILEEKIEAKIEVYANQIAEKITNNLK